MEEIFSIKGKIVLITGSSRGFGLNFAKGFVQAGATVIINGQNPERVEAVVAGFQAEGKKVYGFPFDTTNEVQVEESIARIEEEVGPIEVLVNNAGIQRRIPLEEYPPQDWREVIEVNLTGVFIVSQAVAKFMIKRRSGKIINVTSLNAEGVRETIAPYCAAKGGLKVLTKSMATEWGKYNIRANAIGPGYFITDMTRSLAEDPEFDAWVKAEVPLARWGRVDELIGPALFLATEASSYINGQTIYVDGGWLASL